MVVIFTADFVCPEANIVKKHDSAQSSTGSRAVTRPALSFNVNLFKNIALSALDQHSGPAEMSRLFSSSSRRIRKERKQSRNKGTQQTTFNSRRTSGMRLTNALPKSGLSHSKKAETPVWLKNMLVKNILTSRMVLDADRRKNKKDFMDKFYRRSHFNSQRRLKNEIMSTTRSRAWRRM